MLDAAAKALAQMVTPPFRTVLLKSVGLALVLIVLIGIGLNRLFVWLAGAGEGWAESLLGGGAHWPLSILAWVLSIVATLGIVVGAVFLMPAVTALVASFFVDDIAFEVERSHYPNEPAGAALPLTRAAFEGVKTALLAVLIYLLAVPFLLFAGLGLVIFFLATAFLLGREYFELAAMRFHSPADAKLLRKAPSRHGVSRRHVHRRLRVDPDRQPGDPAVRHGVHGAHAQASGGSERIGVTRDTSGRWSWLATGRESKATSAAR